jgi:hypothetical protein
MNVAPLVNRRGTEPWAVSGENTKQAWHRHGWTVIEQQPVRSEPPLPRAGPAGDLDRGGPGRNRAQQDRATRHLVPRGSRAEHSANLGNVQLVNRRGDRPTTRFRRSFGEVRPRHSDARRDGSSDGAHGSQCRIGAKAASIRSSQSLTSALSARRDFIGSSSGRSALGQLN